MTSTESHSTELPDNLPLLTQVVEEDTQDDLPILTERVAEPESEGWQFGTPAARESFFDTTEIVAESLPAISEEDHAADVVTTDDDLLGLLASFERKTPLQDSEDQDISIAPETGAPAPCPFTDLEIQRLLHHLETHLETVLEKKLVRQLEQLQQMAIQQAVSELKSDLPEILRDALSARTGL